MRLADLFQRLHAAALILAGRVALPDVPPSKLEIAMALEKTKASLQQLEDALDRAAGNDAVKDQKIASLSADNSALQSEVDNLDAEVASLVQAALDKANQLAPAPAPGTAPNGGTATV